MKDKTTTQTKGTRAKASNPRDALYQYIGEMEKLSGKFPRLPAEMMQDHKNLIRKASEQLVSQMNMKF